MKTWNNSYDLFSVHWSFNVFFNVFDDDDDDDDNYDDEIDDDDDDDEDDDDDDDLCSHRTRLSQTVSSTCATDEDTITITVTSHDK